MLLDQDPRQVEILVEGTEYIRAEVGIAKDPSLGQTAADSAREREHGFETLNW
ncbi:hypothetical protein ACS8Y6_08960 [Salinisphaera sp. RV14]|uniref:hypothetical protein n=1 Tax=unclassified Salinisphaera TaxID=2649847 RepID=UPI003F876520